jgi:hypothetical protein
MKGGIAMREQEVAAAEVAVRDIGRPRSMTGGSGTGSRTRRRSSLLGRMGLLAVAVLAAACAPAPVGVPVPDRGVPGFDTREYPGDAAMRTWFDASPYRWVGYYLPAPCHTGAGWSGRRATLQQMGWGLAVLYVGEQDWAAMRAAGDTTPVMTGPRCATENLTAARGAEHAADAAAVAQADGFANGTVIYLDVERVERVSPELAAYVRSWVGSLLDDARYLPGLYAHDQNATTLLTILTEEMLRRQRVERPRLWVAKQAGFDVRRSPSESGYPGATAWQGIFDTRESWGGVELLIDVNVADTRNPSGP